jgi:hypothetical protein
LYGAQSALSAAGEVGHELLAIHLMIENLGTTKSGNPSVVEALAELMIFHLGGTIFHDPRSGKQHREGGQIHAAPARSVNIFHIFVYHSFTCKFAHHPLLSLRRCPCNLIIFPVCLGWFQVHQKVFGLNRSKFSFEFLNKFEIGAFSVAKFSMGRRT